MIHSAMLVTTCPDCRTTFRVSPEILEQAKGQVRCGRCNKIFDGNSALRELAEPNAPSARDVASERVRRGETEPAPGGPSSAHSEPQPEKKTESKPQRGAREADEPDWLNDAPTNRRRVRAWAIAAGVMALALAGQFMHRFRAELSGLPTIGPVVSGAYAQIGIDVAPPVDLAQYDLLDLTAAAQPLGQEPGWLIIETRVINEGPKVQPYPHIFVRLLDRWDTTVAGRYFAPEEYSVSTIADASRMNAGTTADAQFVIMDPGPNATGFELEICTPIVRGYVCESDVPGE